MTVYLVTLDHTSLQSGLGAQGLPPWSRLHHRGKSDCEEDDDPDCVDAGLDIDENVLIKQSKIPYLRRNLFSNIGHCSVRRCPLIGILGPQLFL